MELLDKSSSSVLPEASDAEAGTKATAVESLAARLKSRILNGDFEPGSFLRDVKMADEYDDSRHTFVLRHCSWSTRVYSGKS